jgi:Protein of unknown function (DUF3662)/FHA domain
MNLLKSVETTIANLVEGAFGRVFRSEVRPMELAHKLTREMDAHRTVSVSRTYVPNEYAIWLSPEDRERYEGMETEVIGELSGYLLEHARREQLILPGPPSISFHTDERLSLGEFGIQARSAGGAEKGASAPEEGGHTMIYSTSARTRDRVQRVQSRPPRALLAVGGRRLLVPPGGGVVGRSRECDVVLDDAGVSRRHIEVRPEGDGWVLRDLGSTNGVLVDGREVRDAHLLHGGERIALGSTEIVFEVG